MDDLFESFDNALLEITNKFEIKNLKSIEWDREESYWVRLARRSFFKKLYDNYNYHFLYEIQGLSSQIHFGILNCILFKDKISTELGKPNLYNHRYTFMIESTIHCIYSFWNRVGLVLNTYLKNPSEIKRVYFGSVVSQLLKDFPMLENDNLYQWLCQVKEELERLDRNEFAHNNSLIMQNFLTMNGTHDDFKTLLTLPDLLMYHNKLIVDDIYNLVFLIEKIEPLV